MLAGNFLFSLLPSSQSPVSRNLNTFCRPNAPSLHPPPNNNPSTATATAGPRYGDASFHAQDEENWTYLFPGVPVPVPSPTQIPHNPLTVNNTTFFPPPFIPTTHTHTRRTPFTSNTTTTRPTNPPVNPPQPPPQAPKKTGQKTGSHPN